MTASSVQLMPARPINKMSTINVTATNNDVTNNNRIININNIELSGVRRCLFGVPDSNETKRLLREQEEDNRKRFLEVWGYDIFTEKFVGSPTIVNATVSKGITIEDRLQNNFELKNDKNSECENFSENKNSFKSQLNSTQKDKRITPYSVKKTLPDYWKSTKKTTTTETSKKV